MALPIVIAKNQTASPIFLPRLGLTVPATPATITLTDFASFYEISWEAQLYTSVGAGDIVINDGVSDLSTAVALGYLDATGNMNGPVTGLVTDVLIRLDGTTGRYTKSTGITVDNSNNMNLGSGNITTTGTINLAGGVFVFPTATAPAPTTEGQAAWDTDDDVLRVGTGSGTANLVTGPASSQDNGVVRFDGTTGKIQDSVLTLSDTGVFSRTSGDITIQTVTAGDINLTPAGLFDVTATGNASINATEIYLDSPTLTSVTSTAAVFVSSADTEVHGTNSLLLQAGAGGTVTVSAGTTVGITGTSGITLTSGVYTNNAGSWDANVTDAATLDATEIYATATDGLYLTGTVYAGLSSTDYTDVSSSTTVSVSAPTVDISAPSGGTITVGVSCDVVIGSDGSLGNVSLLAGSSRTLSLGANATSHTVVLGSTSAGSITTIQAGAGQAITLTAPLVVVGTAIRIPNTGLRVRDTDNTHDLTIAPGSNLSAARTLTLTTGDTSRTIDITGAQGSVYYTNSSGNLVALAPGTSGQYLRTNGAAADPSWAAAGDVVGPASSQDNGVVRFDGITGKLIQDSALTLNDTGGFERTAGNISLETFTSGDIVLTAADSLSLSATGVDFTLSGPVGTISTSGQLDITSGSFLLTGSGLDSTIRSTSANLDLQTITSGQVRITSAGSSDWQSAGNLTLDSSGGAITIGGDADAQPINIGTGAAARPMVIGNSTGATALSLNVGTGNLNLGTNATAHTVVIGSTTGASAITEQTGTGAYTVNAGGVWDINATGAVTIDGPGISIDGTSASNLSVTGAGLTLSTITSGTLAVTSAAALNLSGTTGDWQASGALTLDSSGGAISIGGDADAQAINVGTGAAARTITIGNVTGATALALNAGTGSSSWTLTGAGTFSLVAGTGAVALASNATDHSTTLGSTTGTSATTIQSGTGNLTLTSPDVRVGTILTTPNTGLHILDTNASHDLIIAPGSDLTADRTLTLTTGDVSRTVDITGAQGSVYYTDASGNLVALAPGTSGQVLQTNGAAANPSWATAGTGDVVGPASATDNAVARFDGTTGKLIQDSSFVVSDNASTVTLSGLTGAIHTFTTSSTNTALELQGNKAATGTADVIVNSSVARTSNYIFEVQNNGSALFRVNFDGSVTASILSRASGQAAAFKTNGTNHTGQTAGANIPNWHNQNYTRTWATGAITTQHEIEFNIPTYAAAAASVMTDAANLYVEGAPAAGTNMTITNAYALWVDSGTSRFDGAVQIPNTGLQVYDTDSSHFLSIVPGSNLTAARNLTLTTGDASRTIDLTGAQGSIYYTDASGNLVPLAPGVSGQVLQTNGAAANPSWATVAGTGDVVGPASSQDNGVVRFDGTTGKLIQDSSVTISDTGVIANAGTAASLGATNTNTPLILAGNRNAGVATTDVEVTSTLARTAGALLAIQNNSVDVARFRYDGALLLSMQARTSGTAQALGTLGTNHTGQTASTEIPNWQNTAYSRQWATGAIATQREIKFEAPTYAFVGASTITDAANLYIEGAPIAGTNATITNAYALWVDSGTSRFDGNVQIPNTGLQVYDTDSSHFLSIVPGSNLTAARTLTLTTGDASRTIDLTGAQGSIYYTDASGNLVALAPGTSGQVLQTNGAAANPSWATASGGGGAGTTTVDFGSAAAGSQQASTDITGQTSILGTSKIKAWVTATATADHNAAEHTLVPFRVVVRDIVAGTGFTIQVISDWHLNGTFTVQWEWV